MNNLSKYEPEYGTMKESGAGQFVRLYDYRSLEGEVYTERCKNQSYINKIEELEAHIKNLENINSCICGEINAINCPVHQGDI